MPADDSLVRIAAALERPFTLADVGGRFGLPDRWRNLVPPCRAVAFEADEAECERLRAEATSDAVRYEPVALGSRAGPATLYLTIDPACSSLYVPDGEVMAAHPELLLVAALIGERTIDVQTLDSWCSEEADVHFDALKLDVQGAELDVLRGAEHELIHVVMLEVEVELNQIYVRQPLFADVDHFLRAHGFALWRLGHLVHYGRLGLDSTTAIADLQAFDSRGVDVPAQGGQLFWGHAHYLARDVLDAGATTDRRHRAAIAAGGFGFPDLATLLLT